MEKRVQMKDFQEILKTVGQKVSPQPKLNGVKYLALKHRAVVCPGKNSRSQSCKQLDNCWLMLTQAVNAMLH